LVGGDTTKGPLTVAIQVHGFVNSQAMMTRSGACEGDILAVTGTLGDAGAALGLLDKSSLSESEKFLLDRYYKPSPRIEIGLKLSALASACIDLSDGLFADAMHIADKSSVQLEIDLGLLPISPALRGVTAGRAEEFAVSAGDDYELLFSISEQNWQRLAQDGKLSGCSRVGRVNKGKGVVAMRDGKVVNMTKQGYKHFE